MQEVKTHQSIRVSLLILKESVKSFLRNNNFEMSVALSSYGFFAIMPLLFFVAFMLSNYALLSSPAAKATEDLMRHIFPGLGSFTMKELFFSTNYKIAWGAIGILMIFLSLMSLNDSLRTSFLKIFKISNEASFVTSQLKNLMAVLIFIAFFVFLVFTELFCASVSGELLKKAPFIVDNGPLIGSFLVMMMCMVVVYVVFSPTPLKISYLLVVSLITSILIVLMKNLFALFITFNPEYGSAFGAFKIFFVMIIWVYYCFLVILFGAEIIVHINKRDILLLKPLFLRGENSGNASEKLINKFITCHNAGDVVFMEGEQGDKMFYIVYGAVDIIRNQLTIRTMGRGEHFGEMSMLLDMPRTATVVALEPDTRLVNISQGNFEAILREDPDIILAILKEMTMRLKITNESL